jgi:hypothetical protein
VSQSTGIGVPSQPPDDPVRPTVTEIGAILRARTRSDTTGEELGTFDNTTRPTQGEVDVFIDVAEAEVDLRLPADLSALSGREATMARRATALRAAMLVELSYDPDRTDTQDSAYQRLSDLFDAAMRALTDVLEDEGLGGDDRRGWSVPVQSQTAAASIAAYGLYPPDELLP